ncbi:MAG: NUDIX hydrolase [Ignavibacteriales bacterium CG_4_9_14_3_um_filter_34_10]|nr:MAG: NUDIX hydrolase [Ignavibacteriales bacterium CG_4_9_14_3_um_filter_34_10]
MNEKWLDWAREIQSLCQTGLAFASTGYEVQRYKRLIEISSDIISQHTNLDKSTLEKVLMEQPGYATPKIDVRAAVFNEGKILLVQESTDRNWSMPGGWADVGDFPAAVAERETLEESGYIVKAKKLIGVFDANRSGRPLEFFHAFKLIFLCELKGGNARISDETLDVKFFNLDELPPLSENRTNMRHINEIKVHLADNSRLAFFE